jgi:hypothetical protein
MKLPFFAHNRYYQIFAAKSQAHLRQSVYGLRFHYRQDKIDRPRLTAIFKHPDNISIIFSILIAIFNLYIDIGNLQ